MSSKIAVAVSVAAVSCGQWTFHWPYKTDGSCECVQRPSDFVSFETEAECLEAFADSPFEYCSYGGRAVNEEQCDASVAKSQGLYNTVCEGKCTQLVAGLIETRDFFETCDFEFFVEFDDDGSVAVPGDSCFNNLIYGWADYDPSNTAQEPPLRIFSDVPSPTRCQELCQNIPECVHFSWRALPNNATEDLTFTFQNEPHTCILHDAEYMANVIAYQVTPPGTLLPSSKYCDVRQIVDCQKETFPRESFNLFALPHCLLCDCVPRCSWISPVHLSGPAFCEAGPKEQCAYSRPIWTTTTPQPCPTEECPTAEAQPTGDISTQDAPVSTASVVSDMPSSTVQDELTTQFTSAATETSTTILLETTEDVTSSSTIEFETVTPVSTAPVEELTSTTPNGAMQSTSLEELTSTTPSLVLESSTVSPVEPTITPVGSVLSGGVSSSAPSDVSVTPEGSQKFTPAESVSSSSEDVQLVVSTTPSDVSVTPEGSLKFTLTGPSALTISSQAVQHVASSTSGDITAEASQKSGADSQLVNPSVPGDVTTTPVGSVIAASTGFTAYTPSLQPPCEGGCAQECVEDCYPNYHYEEEDCMEGC